MIFTKNILFIPSILFCLLAMNAKASQWRSVLYPANWQPGMKDSNGRSLHDFSFAGYRYGERAIPLSPPGPTFNVFTGFGADPYGTYDSTPEIQAAINAASKAGGGIVYIPAGYYKLDGELSITSSKVVLRGAGPQLTKLRFNSTVAGKAHIGFYGNVTNGSDLSLTQNAENLSTLIKIQNSSSLKVGDDISVGWIVTDSFIAEHFMTGTWTVSRNIWWPFFRRKVVAINNRVSPNEITLDVPIRYPAKMRDSASIRKEVGYLEEVGVEQLGISNVSSYKTAWTANGVKAISLTSVKNSWVKNVKSFSPPEDKSQLFHLQSVGIQVKASKNVTVINSQMEGAQNRGGNGNGYLFELKNSNDILIQNSSGFRGRHNFIQNGDFSTNGCVFLRVDSRDSRGYQSVLDPIGAPYFSEYHRSLSTANLVDQSNLRDGWLAYNRGMESSGAGHTSTQNVFWNVSNGAILSYQFGYGYVIGTTNTSVSVTATGALLPYAQDTGATDFIEGLGQGATLFPASLYENQLSLRLARIKNAPVLDNPNANNLTFKNASPVINPALVPGSPTRQVGN